MSEDKKKLKPMNIKVDEDLLEKLVACGVESVMQFKLCRLVNDYDVDSGERDMYIRVCGGPMCIECECDQKPQSLEIEDKAVVLTNDLYREDEF